MQTAVTGEADGLVEQLERLLRVLEFGLRIKFIAADFDSASLDYKRQQRLALLALHLDLPHPAVAHVLVLVR